MRFIYRAGLVCIGLFLASCAEMPKQAATELDWQHRAARLSSLSHWNASGKLAIRTTEQSESANLEWVQADKVTRIVLSGPMGLGATSIESDQLQLQISHDGKTQQYDISSAAASNANIGWDLPIQALPSWILGLPSPQGKVQGKVIENGLLRQMEQLGWTVTYESYGQFEQYILPTRMKIERESTRARLIIRNWTGFSS